MDNLWLNVENIVTKREIACFSYCPTQLYVVDTQNGRQQNILEQTCNTRADVDISRSKQPFPPQYLSNCPTKLYDVDTQNDRRQRVLEHTCKTKERTSAYKTKERTST